MANIIPVSSMIRQAPDFNREFEQGVQFGQRQRDRSEAREREQQVRNLAPQVISGDPAAYSQAAAIDPKAAGDYQGAGDAQLRRFKGFVSLIDNARAQAQKTGDWRHVDAALQQASPYLTQLLGKPGPTSWPQGDPQWEAGWEGLKARIAGATGGGADNPYEGLPSDIQSLRLLQDNPELASLDRERRQAAGMVPKLVNTTQGIGWGTPGAGIQLAPLEGVAGQQPQQAAPAQELFAALGQKYGIQPTSIQRTPERNAEVGGVPNSYHLSGQAADWIVPQQYKQQFIRDAQQYGYEAIDEGDHVHIEPAGQRGGAGAPGGVAQPYQAPQRTPIPAGYRETPDGNMEVVPGGPADPNVIANRPMTPAQRQKLEQTQRKEQSMVRSMNSSLDESIRMIDDLLANRGSFGGLTGLGAAGARIPGTRWADLDAKLTTLKARSAFGSLQEMRANSPTGGALGQVSERELDLLMNAETQLKQTQSPEALASALENYKRILQGSKRRLNEGVEEFYADTLGGQTPGSATSASVSSEIDSLLDMYR